MLEINWAEMLGFTVSPLELVIRGSVTYLFLFLVFRFILHRDVGNVGLADILLIVIVADASQNSMAGGYKSVSDGIVLIGTIVGWNYAIDHLSYRHPVVRRFARPKPLCLIKDGVKQQQNMHEQLITDEELQALLREHGVEAVGEVKRAYLEADGEISVIKRRKKDDDA